MKSTTSKFASHFFTAEIAGIKTIVINYRILKMDNSVFIYIGPKDDEQLSGLALGLIIPNQSEKSTATSILESQESKDMAQKLSVRLNKPVFVSCNVNLDRHSAPVVEKHLIEKIKERPECF
jgi:proteasome assembly chaperone 4